MDDARIAKLYADGMSVRQLGIRTGLHHSTILRRVRAVGVDVRSPGRTPAKPRKKCERKGCDNRVRRRGRRHCSNECRHADRVPPAPPRTCELDSCDVVFTPAGQGRFHSRACWYAWIRAARPRAEQVIAAEAQKDGVYFVRVSRQLAAEMDDWSEPVQVRFEVSASRAGEAEVIVRLAASGASAQT